MQQRYCTCGQAVWVHYINYIPSGDNVLFTSHKDDDELLCICPNCGYTLNINELP